MLYPHLNGKRVILASQSPRRLELVKGLELEPVTWLKDVDESFPDEITGPAIAEYVTRLKAEAYWDELGADDVLITGDTVVLLGDEVLQKPVDRNEAIGMLRAIEWSNPHRSIRHSGHHPKNRHSIHRRHLQSDISPT